MKKLVLTLVSLTAFLFADQLSVGTEAPNFSLKDETGKVQTLAQHKGNRPVILVFYPGDNTPVCTKQLCELRDNYADLPTYDSVQVYGVNAGDAQSHQKFKEKNRYPFPLLVDTKWETAKKYGISNGKGVNRTVYVIDKNGKIIYSQKGKPPVSEILAALKAKN